MSYGSQFKSNGKHLQNKKPSIGKDLVFVGRINVGNLVLILLDPFQCPAPAMFAALSSLLVAETCQILVLNLKRWSQPSPQQVQHYLGALYSDDSPNASYATRLNYWENNLRPLPKLAAFSACSNLTRWCLMTRRNLDRRDGHPFKKQGRTCNHVRPCKTVFQMGLISTASCSWRGI